MPVKIGLLGAGFMGRMHALCYKTIPDAALVAVSDTRPQQAAALAAEHGAAPYGSMEDLLDRAGLDAIDICLPTDLHEEAIDAALRHGVHCIVEKPLSVTPSRARRIADAAKGMSSLCMVAHVIRFWPEYEFLTEAVHRNRWGRLLSLALTRMSPRPGWTAGNWNMDPKRSVGALLELHIHDTDFVRFLLGEPRGVDSCGVKLNGAWDYVATNYDYPGVAVSAIGGWNLPGSVPFRMTYQAVFERGYLDFDSTRNPTVLLHRDGAAPEPPPVARPDIGSAEGGGNISSLDGYYNELKYFVDCVKTGRQAERCSAEDAASSVELVYREMASAQEKLQAE